MATTELPDSICQKCIYHRPKGCGHPEYGKLKFQCYGDFDEPRCLGIPKVLDDRFWEQMERIHHAQKL